MQDYTEQSNHPVPCIDAIILNEKHEVLLIRRDVPPFKGSWTLIGGRVEVQDNNTEQTVTREVKEETGLEIEITYLAGIIADPSMDPPPDPRFFVVQVVYVVKPTGGSLRINDEVSEFKWVPIEEVLDHELGFNHRDIYSMFVHRYQTSTLIPAKRRFYTENFDKEFVYTVQNQYPRFAANAIILNENKQILLARRSQAPFIGCWDFPGGHIYVGETIEDCVKREMREELGVDAKMGELFHVYSDKGKHPKAADVVSYYFVTIASNDFVKNIEMDKFEYFSFDNLPGHLAFHNQYPLKDIREFLHV